MALKDKVVIITGAGSVKGLGAATALYMIQFGAKLVLAGRNRERLDEVRQRCMDAGLSRDKCLPVVGDVTKDSDLEDLVTKTLDTFKKIDVLVNNAAICTYSSTATTSMMDFDRVMDTNLRSPFYLTQLCLPHLIKTKGNIVNVSSISGSKAVINWLDFRNSGLLSSYTKYTSHVPFDISKAALDHFTRIVANEVAHEGVRVNSVNPGAIVTDIHNKSGLTDEQYAKREAKQKRVHPLGRAGDPLEVAKAIVFLASDQASFTTGQMLFVDGGRNIKAW